MSCHSNSRGFVCPCYSRVFVCGHVRTVFPSKAVNSRTSIHSRPRISPFFWPRYDILIPRPRNGPFFWPRGDILIRRPRNGPFFWPRDDILICRPRNDPYFWPRDDILICRPRNAPFFWLTDLRIRNHLWNVLDLRTLRSGRASSLFRLFLKVSLMWRLRRYAPLIL